MNRVGNVQVNDRYFILFYFFLVPLFLFSFSERWFLLQYRCNFYGTYCAFLLLCPFRFPRDAGGSLSMRCSFFFFFFFFFGPSSSSSSSVLFFLFIYLSIWLLFFVVVVAAAVLLSKYERNRWMKFCWSSTGTRRPICCSFEPWKRKNPNVTLSSQKTFWLWQFPSSGSRYVYKYINFFEKTYRWCS